MDDWSMGRIKGDADSWQPFANLRGMVRLVLCVDWDPIELFGHRQTLDEYDAYAGGIVGLLERGAARDEIINHLRNLHASSMGIRTPEGRNEFTADKLLRMYHNYAEISCPGEPES